MVFGTRPKRLPLRHDSRSIEDLHEGTRLDPVLHNVPLNPRLRRRVRDRPWPRSAGLFLVEAEELRLGCGGIPDRRRVVQLVPPHTGPGSLLSS